MYSRMYRNPSKLLLKAILTKLTTPDEMKRILAEDCQAARVLTADDCFEAMVKASDDGLETAVHLLLDYTEKVCDEDDLAVRIRLKGILQKAIKWQRVSLVKRLVTMIKVDEFNKLRNAYLSPLVISTGLGLADVTEILIGAGFDPDIFLFLIPKYEGQTTDQGLKCLHQLCRGEMTDSEKEVWELLIPHFTPRGIISSRLLYFLTMDRIGSQMLHTFKLLGVNFTPLVTSHHPDVKSCFREALRYGDLGMVKFITRHGFDANISLYEDLFCPPLQCYISTTWQEDYFDVFIEIIEELVMGDADPWLKDAEGPCAVDLCVANVIQGNVYENHALVLLLFLNLGHILSEEVRNTIRSMPSLQFSDLVIEMDLVPSLQTLCRKTIRCEKGSKIKEYMDHLDYPMKLKDFVLLKNFDWEEFKVYDEEFLKSVESLMAGFLPQSH